MTKYVQMQTKGILETLNGRQPFEAGDYLATDDNLNQYIVSEKEYGLLQEREQNDMWNAYESAYQDEEFVNMPTDKY